MSTDAFTPVSFPRLRPLSVTEAERARARERGYAEGHAEGYRAAVTEAAAVRAQADAERAARERDQARAANDALVALASAAGALRRRAEELTAATRAEVFARAVELAELILAAELADDEASATAALRRAVMSADPDDVHQVHLHPEDLRTLESAGARTDGLVLVADDSLERGDAIVALDEGHVDARIASALERARHSLEGGS